VSCKRTPVLWSFVTRYAHTMNLVSFGIVLLCEDATNQLGGRLDMTPVIRLAASTCKDCE
jgi:hypothetical protein